MKTIRSLLFIALFFTISVAALSAKAPKEPTGDDWIRMLQDEQLEFVSVSIKAYEQQGVTIQRPAAFYVYALNTTIAGNSLYESENLTDILNKILLKNEPALKNREAAAQSAKIQKIETH